MNKFGLNTSFIITADQEQSFLENGKEIIVIPFYKWILGE
jgi:predicted AAA+ superfamily ATPase